MHASLHSFSIGSIHYNHIYIMTYFMYLGSKRINNFPFSSNAISISWIYMCRPLPWRLVEGKGWTSRCLPIFISIYSFHKPNLPSKYWLKVSLCVCVSRYSLMTINEFLITKILDFDYNLCMYQLFSGLVQCVWICLIRIGAPWVVKIIISSYSFYPINYLHLSTII